MSFIYFLNRLKYSSCLSGIIGGSPAIERFRRHLPSLAKDLTPLIFIGERGVGKAFLATHIHAASPLNTAPPESLNFTILSGRDQRVALFGGEPPELTTTRRSLLELPTTLILKHIDQTDHYIQDKLVSSITEGRLTRFGAQEYHPVLCRIIFTFRESLPSLVRKGKLSQLLYTFCSPLRRIHLTPLRKRVEDIPLLAESVVEIVCGELEHVTWRGFDGEGRILPALAELLQNQMWEDNIRDLFAYVRSLRMPTPEEELDENEKRELIKLLLMIEGGSEFSLADSLSRIKDSIIGRAFKKQAGRSTMVAHLLGLSDRAIRRRNLR